MNQFINYYNRTKKLIKKEIELVNIELLKENNPYVQENMKVFGELNKNGKLIRGILITLGYYFKNENIAYSIPLAASYELFQTSVLVHDDIIDQDDKRRGVNTIHFENYNKYKSYNDVEAKHLSNSIAICMGDYGLYEAIKVISTAYKDDPNLSKVLTNFINTALNTVRGEIIDVVLPFEVKNEKVKNDLLEESIMNIYRLKTAHYTIIGPLSVGLLLAGANEEKIKDISLFGEKVGIAFQIQDDILGIYSDEMGKVIGSDIKEFKQTILYSHISKTNYIDELKKYYGKDITNEFITFSSFEINPSSIINLLIFPNFLYIFLIKLYSSL